MQGGQLGGNAIARWRAHAVELEHQAANESDPVAAAELMDMATSWFARADVLSDQRSQVARSLSPVLER